MTDRERFERAFAPVRASADTVTEVLKMTEANKKTRRTGAPRRAARVALIAAIIFVLLIGSACAAGLYVNSPEQAWKIAQREIQKMKDMGILSQEVQIGSEAKQIIERREETDPEFYFERLFKRRYDIRVYGDGKYAVNLYIDMETGKITYLSVGAKADEKDEKVERVCWNGEKAYYHANYDDIIPADMTVDKLCTLLGEYWGFTGYSLSSTKDGFYRYDTDVPSGDMLVSELGDGPYLTVYFDGDQSGVPMYIDLYGFIGDGGGVYVNLGTNHGIG